MRVLKTNWINILGVFIVVLLYALVLNVTDTNVSRNVFQSVLSALILVCLYGLMFWALFVVLLIVCDWLFIVRNRNKLPVWLLLEWIVVSSPFVYWAVNYREWIFIAGVCAFLITQSLRARRIAKL